MPVMPMYNKPGELFRCFIREDILVCGDKRHQKRAECLILSLVNFRDIQCIKLFEKKKSFVCARVLNFMYSEILIYIFVLEVEPW